MDPLFKKSLQAVNHEFETFFAHRFAEVTKWIQVRY